MGRSAEQAFGPQAHPPGAEAEVDFADLWVQLDGVLTQGPGKVASSKIERSPRSMCMPARGAATPVQLPPAPAYRANPADLGPLADDFAGALGDYMDDVAARGQVNYLFCHAGVGFRQLYGDITKREDGNTVFDGTASVWSTACTTCCLTW